MRQALELALAGTCFATGVVCCAGSWRTMLAMRIGIGGAVARYGVGSLTNTFLPGRAGDAVRLGLFGRIAPGGVIAVAGAVAGIGAVRWLALVPLGIAGTLRSTLPPLALVIAAAALLPLPLVWVLARRGSRRARAALAPLRCAGRATYAMVIGWVCGTLVARVVGVTLAGAALGIPHPLGAALLVVPALELAGVIPLTPANVGIAGGAAAVAFHAQGVPMHTALAAGLGVHAVETVAALAVGGTSAVALVRAGVRILPLRKHRDFRAFRVHRPAAASSPFLSPDVPPA
jgi:Lysylphosphatidylglycerol synthase TM region